MTAIAAPVARLSAPFWRLWTASTISRFGDAVRDPALALVAASLTRDPQIIALVVVASQLPPLLFGLLSGVLADRCDRRLSMAGADALRFFLVAGLAILIGTGHASVPLLIFFAFALSTVGTLFDSSAFAILPQIVPPDQLGVANGRTQVGQTIAGGMLGAPAAGLLFVTAAGLPFAIDAVTFAVAAVLALTLPRVPRHELPKGSLWGDGVAGVRWLVREPALRLLAILSAASNFVIGAIMAVLVLLVLDVFGIPESAYGFFLLVGAGGAIVGGLVAGRLGSRLMLTLRWVLLMQTAALGLLVFARHPIPGGIALSIFIAGTAVWNVLSNAYRQKVVPGELLGRVGAAGRVISVATAPIGALLGGLAGASFGVESVAVFGVTIFALMIIGSWRAMRRCDR